MKTQPTTADKNKKDDKYIEAGKHKFAKQRKSLIIPYTVCFLVEMIMFIVLMVMDTPQVVFDDSSRLFAILLLINTLIPLISLLVVLLAKTTLHLLVTISLHQACIITLIIGWLIKYEEMKNCSSYHMLIFYFFFVISWLAMTTVLFNVKTKINSMEQA
jgi:hypothetical protein